MSGRRVVLLARAGGARERTEAALKQADAELLATFDPATVEADQIRAGDPEVLLVVLDPVVESLLDGFADLFGDPGLDVMFDDAEIAARREGWEEARWIRHLHAKLHGHDDVLPRVGGREPPSTFVDMEHLSREVAAMPDLPQAGNGGKGQVAGAVVIFAGVGGPMRCARCWAAYRRSSRVRCCCSSASKVGSTTSWSARWAVPRRCR